MNLLLQLLLRLYTARLAAACKDISVVAAAVVAAAATAEVSAAAATAEADVPRDYRDSKYSC